MHFLYMVDFHANSPMSYLVRSLIVLVTFFFLCSFITININTANFSTNRIIKYIEAKNIIIIPSALPNSLRGISLIFHSILFTNAKIRVRIKKTKLINEPLVTYCPLLFMNNNELITDDITSNTKNTISKKPSPFQYGETITSINKTNMRP